MSQNEAGNHSNRRKFLTGALAAAAISAAGGAGLALRPKSVPLTQEMITAMPTAAAAVVRAPGSTGQQELMGKLAASQAENVRLQALVDGLNRRLAVAESGRVEAGDETTLLQNELANSQNKVGVLAGLVALYEQLEEVDLADTVTGGLTTLAGHLGEVVGNIPGLDEALEAGDIAIASFERDIPALENGRAWFSDHLSQLSRRWQLFEGILREITESVGDTLGLLQSWFDKILGWVPFEFGARTRNGLNALFDLVQFSPQTIERGQSELLGVMDQWLKPEVGQQTAAVHSRLVQPLREGVMGQAAKASAGVKTMQTVFQEELVAKTAVDLANRAEIAQLIERYRHENEV